MARDDKGSERGEFERKQWKSPRGNGTRSKNGYAGRPGASEGHGGYGSESVRPYLRAQLRLKELMLRAGNLVPSPWEEDKPSRRKSSGTKR